jgi:hypothetical protein
MKKESEDPTVSAKAAYEKQIFDSYGERVAAFTLGQYLAGWQGWNAPLWGLFVVTDKGVRFHHFPHEGWLGALFRAGTGGKGPEEKMLFIPNDAVVSCEFVEEKNFFKKIAFGNQPLTRIVYRDEEGAENELRIETNDNICPRD